MPGKDGKVHIQNSVSFTHHRQPCYYQNTKTLCPLHELNNMQMNHVRKYCLITANSLKFSHVFPKLQNSLLIKRNDVKHLSMRSAMVYKKTRQSRMMDLTHSEVEHCETQCTE